MMKRAAKVAGIVLLGALLSLSLVGVCAFGDMTPDHHPADTWEVIR